MLTLNDLVLAVARRHRGGLGGTATGGTSTTLVDTLRLVDPANAWTNFFVRMISGSQSGQERLVTAYSQAARTVTFDPAMGGAVANGDQYQLLPVRRDVIEDAIQAGVRAAGAQWLVQRSVEDIAITDDQVYALPADVLIVNAAYVGFAGYWYPWDAFTVTGNSGAYSIMLRELKEFPITRDTQLGGQAWNVLRVDYVAMPDLAGATDTLGLGDYSGEAEEFIIEHALYVLKVAAFNANPTSEAARASFTAAQTHYQNAQTIKQRARMQAHPTRATRRALPRHVQG